MPRALVSPKISAKRGCAALCNATARKITASGETNTIAGNIRQSNLKFTVTPSSNRPSHGAMRNQAIMSGKKDAAMRDKYETSASL